MIYKNKEALGLWKCTDIPIYEDEVFMDIIEISNDLERQNITRYILESLPEWFGLAESREEYIQDNIGKIFFCAYSDEKPVGFLYLKETGKDTVELAVMGVLKKYHCNGIGKALFECAKEVICEKCLGYGNISIDKKIREYVIRE